MQELIKKGGKHAIALLIFVLLAVFYFKPAVFEGKTIRQGDMIFASGMGTSQAKQYEATAKAGEFGAWSDAMFGGMPYVATYGNPAPNLPGYQLIEKPVKSIGYGHASMVLAGLICFYILMCVMGVDWRLAIGGAIAFAFASYNLIIIEAGHITKAYVIAYMPLTIAGMVLLFKRKHLWGSILFLLGAALSVGNFHIQITYYLILLCLCLYIGYIIKKIVQKDWKELGIVTALLVVCSVVAVLPNAQKLYVQWEMGQMSIRGATELTTTTDDGEKISSGLDKDYAFGWSYGKKELLTWLIPNAYGGASNTELGRSSEFYKDLRAAGYQVKKEVPAPTFWGDKSFTSGPVYFGAVVCFLFVLGLFVIKSRMKWAYVAGALLLTLLALGRNFDGFNTFIFHNLPMYNKFRTPEMALVIPGLVFPILGFWGLKNILQGKVDSVVLKRGLITALSITGAICVLIWWFPTSFLDFHSHYDESFEMQPWYDALVRDRISMASSDAFRSLAFIVLSAALVFLFIKLKDKKTGGWILCIGITLLILIDLWSIDRRYLNDKDYSRETEKTLYKASLADQEILKDKDLSFRVLTLDKPFTETSVSYYHHSIGGYNAMKLRRYQELIDHRLIQEINVIIQSLKTPPVTLESVQRSFAAAPTLDMLNMRYLIIDPSQPPVFNPLAFGNAWFVPQIKIVANADEEIAALDAVNPLQTAIVDQRFSDELNGFAPQPDSTATIALTGYRPNHLIYSSQASSEQLAVFSEIYYQPGWQAMIDGKPVPHFRADWILRALRVPAGEHKIEFDFRPQGYVTTAYIATFSSCLLLLFLLFGIGYSIWKWRKEAK